MPRNLFWLVLLTLVFPDLVRPQFKVERASEELSFQHPRQFTLYTQSHFNRVEALYLNLGARLQPRRISGFSLYGDAGYGFKNEDGERFRWRAGLQHRLYLPNQLALGAEYYDRVESNDDWIISELENSLAGIFLHEDYKDYFGKEGGRLYADYRLNQTHTLRIDVTRHSYEALQGHSNWSLFGRGKDYLPNPRTGYPVLEGGEVSTRLTAVLDWRDNPIFTIYGWYADAQFELTRDDFETEGLFLTLKRYQPTFLDHRFQIKLLYGSRSGSRAFQHLLTLGGLGNMRGYREKEFVGDRLVYLTANYVIGQQWLRHLPLEIIPIWDAITLGLFVDTGFAWFADPLDPEAGLFDLGEFGLNDLKHDAGLSLIFAENLLRVDFARRLDRSDDNWRITFRILDKF